MNSVLSWFGKPIHVATAGIGTVIGVIGAVKGGTPHVIDAIHQISASVNSIIVAVGSIVSVGATIWGVAHNQGQQHQAAQSGGR